MSMLVHRLTAPLSVLVGAFGLAVWMACFDRSPAGERLGSTLLMVSVTVFIGASFAKIVQTHSRAADVVFQEGYEMGFKQGHAEGREVTRPVLVDMRQRVGASN